jgi:hypothetical protein
VNALALLPITPEQTNTLAALLMVFAGLAAAVAVLSPLARAWARRLEGNAAANPALRRELEELRDRVAELEARDVRLDELEERMDFTERVVHQRALPRVSRADTPPEASPVAR